MIDTAALPIVYLHRKPPASAVRLSFFVRRDTALNDQNQTTKKKEKPSAIDIAIAQDQLNSLREENGIADTARHGPIWHAIDAFFNVRANRVRQKVSRKTYLRLCILGIFGAHRFYAKQWVTGIFYLLTCWTGISIAMTIIDAITVIPMKPDENGMIEL